MNFSQSLHVVRNRYLCNVKRLIKQLFSFLFLLSMSATIFPFHLLHHHEKEVPCVMAKTALENDPGHVSSYHSNDFQEPFCPHKSHIKKQHNQCEYCKFFTSVRDKFIDGSNYSVDHLQLTETDISNTFIFLRSVVLCKIFSRGPPA